MEKALIIQQEVQKILGTEEVYLVGGSVRDLVMGNEPKDYDFCTSMLPEDMIEKVRAAGRRVYTIGEKFGTIGFKVEMFTEKTMPPTKHFEYVEVTTFRSEVYTSKSRKPEVQFVPSLEEDLARRDFTMNAMVLKSDGTIYDPYGGRLDIYAKQIKTVGMPKYRIIEDPLRVLRAARFAARYNFKIDPNFIGKARQLADRIFDVSIERWVQELDKLLTSDYPDAGLQALYEMAIYERILPELHLMTKTPVIKDANEAWKNLLTTKQRPFTEKIKEPSRTIRYINSGICSRLKFSNDRADLILDKKNKKS